MLGVHVTKSSHVLDDKSAPADMSDAIVRDIDTLGLNCAQIFTYGPRFIVPNRMDFEKVKAVTKDIDLTVHSAYATTGIWQVVDDTKHLAGSNKKLDTLKMQLLSCTKINAWGLVLHINRIHPESAVETMAILKPIVKKSKVKLILEMPASKAHADLTYETPEKIDNLTTLIGPDETWWGWCVDTAHLWGAGVDIKSYDSMHKWLERLTYKKKILMFHLNGSSAERGSGKDKHEIAFGPDDKIWKGVDPKKSGVRAIVEFAVKYNIVVICEINRGKQKDVSSSLEAIKDLM